MLDNDILKNYFQTKQYNRCIELLKNKITSFVISTSNFYLDDCSIATALFYALKQDDELKQIELLLSICENNDIK